MLWQYPKEIRVENGKWRVSWLYFNGILKYMSDVFILSAVRSPVGVGKSNGALQPLAPVDLTSRVLVEAVDRAGITPEQVEDVILGCVTPIGDQGANLARLAALKAGFPVRVPGVTLNRMCGSSQQAVHFAAQAILAGDMDIVVAGGTEMMSHQPLGSDWPAEWPADFPYQLVHQGISAELMAEKWGLQREALDDYSYHSHLKAMHAIQNGHFESQILPVALPDGRLGLNRRRCAHAPRPAEDGFLEAGLQGKRGDHCR